MEHFLADLQRSFINYKTYKRIISKIFKDPIHDTINVSVFALKFIYTPEFQRLRNIKQTGSCYYVFMGASHNRYEHSIGVYNLAGLFLDQLKEKHPEIYISERLIELVQLAGLCHDLGHGPMSHAFDYEFTYTIPKSYFKDEKKDHEKFIHHEERSCMILRHIISKYEISINKHEIDFVCSLINPSSDDIKKGFIYQIIANPLNSIDVDKFEYLCRDTYQFGLPYKIDYKLLMKKAMIIDGNICFPRHLDENIIDIYYNRYKLHKRAYGHHTARQIDYMWKDIFALSDEFFDFKGALSNPEKFIKIDDGIFNRLFLFKRFIDDKPENKDKIEKLEKATEILEKIEKRDLYKLVGHKISDKQTHYKEDDFLFDDLSIKKEDLIVENIKIGLANFKCNPLNKVFFYNSTDKYDLESPKTAYTLEIKDISNIISTNYQEFGVRLYVKNPDKQFLARNAFKRVIESNSKSNYLDKIQDKELEK